MNAISIKSKIFLSILLPLCLVTGLSVASYWVINDLLETTAWVEHTHRAINRSSQIEKLMIDLETSERGFLLTGEEAFLQPYQQGSLTIYALIKDTQNLVSDNSKQVRRLQAVEKLVRHWFTEVAEPEIKLRQKISKETKLLTHLEAILGEKQVGKRLFDKIRAELDALSRTFEQSHHAIASRLVLQIAKDLADMETGQRGFLITGKPEFLEPYNAGEHALREHIHELRRVISATYDRKKVQSLVNDLVSLASNWHEKIAQPEMKTLQRAGKKRTGRVAVRELVSSALARELEQAIEKKLATLDKAFEKAKNEHKQAMILAVARNFKDMQNDQHSYIITGDEAFRESYQIGRTNLESQLRELGTVIQSSFDIDETHKHLTTIESLFLDWKVDSAKKEIDIRWEINAQNVRFSDIVQSVMSQKGKKIVDEIRGYISQFIAEEERLLQTRELNAEREAGNALNLILVGTAVILLVGILFGKIFADNVLNRLSTLSRLTDRLSRGEQIDLNADESRDEIGDLIRSVNSLIQSNNKMLSVTRAIVDGDYSNRLAKRSENDQLVESINRMTTILGEQAACVEHDKWVKTGHIALLDAISGEQTEYDIAEGSIRLLAEYMDLPVGAFYILDERNELRLSATYAYTRRKT